jgi:1-acyl-sn-glycerol-3-phosphate acyltransferase
LLADLAAGRPGRAPGPAPDVLAGADSIGKLEAVLAIEAAFGIVLDETALARVRTLDDLDALVVAALAASASRPAAAPAPAAPLPPVPAAAWGRPAAWLLTTGMRAWFRLRVTGWEHLPVHAPCLLCANHASHLDSLALLASAGPARSRLVFAAARDYFFARPRLARWATRALPLIPWERAGRLDPMRENLRHLAACRAGGRIVVFFPEGSRSRTGELAPFGDGLAFLATQTDLPVVPCWIGGTHRALRKGARWPRPGRIDVAFGRPLRATADGPDFAARVRDALLALAAAAP